MANKIFSYVVRILAVIPIFVLLFIIMFIEVIKSTLEFVFIDMSIVLSNNRPKITEEMVAELVKQQDEKQVIETVKPKRTRKNAKAECSSCNA